MKEPEYPQSDSGFPLTVGSLTFLHDAPPKKKLQMAVYRCTCGAETKRDRISTRTAKTRGIKSACKTCGRAKNKRTLQEAILLGLKESGAA